MIKETTQDNGTFLEKINKAAAFELKHQAGTILFSDLVPFRTEVSTGEAFSACLLQFPKDNDADGQEYALFFFVGTDLKNINVIAHADFGQGTPTTESVSLYLTNLSSDQLKENSNYLPLYLQHAISNSIAQGKNAMEVFPQYRDKKMGGLLLAMASAIFEQRGIKNITVSGDLTKGNGKKGFYQRYGAKSSGPQLQRMVIDGIEVEFKREKLDMPTHPTPEQQDLLMKALYT